MIDRKIIHQPIYSPAFLYLRETAVALQSAIEAVASSEKVVIDLGCWDKPYRSLFNERYRTYVGIDLAMHERGVIDVQADAARLPLKSESADVVLCTESLEHCKHTQAVVDEIHRSLKHGGVALLTVVLLFQKHNHADYYRWTDAGVNELFKQFRQVECRPIGDSITCLVSLFNSFIISLLPKKLNQRHTELLRDNIAALIPKLFLDLFFTFVNVLGYTLSRTTRNHELTSSYLVAARK